jgi:hypothetical protein
MAKKSNGNINPKTEAELVRLRKLEREHNLQKREHALLIKPTATIKRNSRLTSGEPSTHYGSWQYKNAS